MSMGAPPPGWWQASDGNWYPPTLHPGQPPGYGAPPVPPRGSGARTGLIIAGVLVALVVVAGIGAAVVVFSVGNTTDRAQSRACRIEGVTIRTALAAWLHARAAGGRSPR